ncbi:MAG: hypothetical protein ACE5LS_00375 [Thermoplasmata archaeon]
MAASEVLPWVALRRGRPLDPRGEGRAAADPDALFRAALKEHGRLLVWDLDGIEGHRPQLDVYRRFEGKGLWVEGGARTVGTLVDILVAGADVAVINRRRMQRIDLLAEATQLTPQLAVCLEEGPGVPPVRADPSNSPADLFSEAYRAGIERGVYLHHAGLQEIPTWVDVLEGMELYAGPVPVSDRQIGTEGRVVANLYELV